MNITFSEFVKQVRSGSQVISFPTDTVPALAALPQSANLIYQIKQRQLDKPLILMAGDVEDLWDYLAGTETERSIWRSMMAKYFPGAVTFVLPASDRVPPQMNPLTPGTIGVRVPNCEAARTILRSTGPLATTSVNRSGEPALLNLTDIRSQFPQVLTLQDDTLRSIGIDPEATSAGIPSTVVRWTENNWEVLRQGKTIVISPDD
jgi:L-threonylcarbamoyladenylate synthase